MKRTPIFPAVALLAGTLLVNSAFALTPPSGGGSNPGNPGPDPGTVTGYQPVTTQYVYKGVTPESASYEDSDHFRIYHGGSRVANVSGRNLDITLAHLEAAYDLFVNEKGFRSAGLSNHDRFDSGPHYKLNVYPATFMTAAGVMLYDQRAGLSYLEVMASQLAEPRVTVHEYGHSLTLSQVSWVDQGRTGAWWETVANWVADTYLNSEYYDRVRQSYGLAEGYTIIDLNKVISNSHLMLVSNQNYYEAWPFLTYITNNPDSFPGLGPDIVRDMLTGHPRNNETPLHVLERLAAPTRVQRIIGRYWARMAYLDIDHPRARQLFFNTRSRLNFSSLDPAGPQTWRVKASRQPAYGGASIHPLRITGNGSLRVAVQNLGNGLADSDFTATLAIRNGNRVRYVDLPGGAGSATAGSGEEVSLVVANTPRTLYQYDAFRSTAASPEMRGLNYEVRLTGAVPAY